MNHIFIFLFLEIKGMMFGFGDARLPNHETAELVEKIVKDQLIRLLNLLSEVAAKTDAKKIGIKEYLLLLRFISQLVVYFYFS